MPLQLLFQFLLPSPESYRKPVPSTPPLPPHIPHPVFSHLLLRGEYCFSSLYNAHSSHFSFISSHFCHHSQYLGGFDFWFLQQFCPHLSLIFLPSEKLPFVADYKLVLWPFFRPSWYILLLPQLTPKEDWKRSLGCF